jgi:hypothetical protein
MPRYIEENVVYGLFNRRGQALLHVGDIDVLPRADAVEVVHGRWIEYQIPHIMCCSECDWGTGVQSDFRYCPNCGAKMEERVEYADD